MIRILVLGGSSPAIDLTHALLRKKGIEVVFSLAGVTENPRLPSGAIIRRGGFGARAGLQSYLVDHGIKMVIDATHPFAWRMSLHALIACERVGCPRLVLEHPSWQRQEGLRQGWHNGGQKQDGQRREGQSHGGASQEEQSQGGLKQEEQKQGWHNGESWHRVADLRSAARYLARQDQQRRVLLTVGSRDWHYFSTGISCHMFVRGMAKPDGVMPDNAHFILQKPPLNQSVEEKLLRGYRIDLLVTKDSGSPYTRAKLDAAHHLGITVLMIARPSPIAGSVVHCLDAALGWIAARF